MPSLNDTKAFRRAMFDKSFSVIEKKGADYNRSQQLGGDTLYNLRVCETLGIVPSAEVGILVRLSDKFMRLISLASEEPAVVDESFEDTVCDIHNYVDYLALIRAERRGKAQTARVQGALRTQAEEAKGKNV